MMPRHALRTLMLLLSLAVAGVLTGCDPQDQAGRYSFTLVTQGDHVLAGNESLVGDSAVAGGSMTLGPRATQHGSVTVLAGELRLEGTVAGNVLVLGGTATLTDTAVVTGDVSNSGGQLVRAPGARVQGKTVEGGTPADVLGGVSTPASPAARAGWILASVLAAAVLAWALVRLAPRPVQRVAAAAAGFPLVSGALGTLVLITVLPLVVAMVFTLFLIPLAAVVLVLSVLTLAYGGIGLGLGLSQTVARLTGRNVPAPRTAAAGTALLAATLQLLGNVPVVGAAAVALTAIVAVGAVVLTGFGLRRYTPPEDMADEPAAGPAARP
ncbi:polymer-forming cytoskeletal protein [Pseudarthrobacter phenanthrenivorans]|uniref:polymer-forming cytoskeletal protein n=1 Tax=Pseudarthrobacter phenanthrenivorans TaxID=361575 RepID=UPI001127B0E0|nr:polymer-forming cytoskeletal protein [Pseudarthrobacter phenanthrenivorans]TPV52525.1 polymer-forming cytoskeletal protein [Pseudarthrobacter phenanthrenivorans]